MQYLVVLFLFLNTFIFAQKPITGFVFSASTNEPLPLANIIVEETSFGTITDDGGKFSIPERYQNEFILVSYIGYKAERVSLKEFEGSGFQKIFLERNIIPSQTVLIKGSIGSSGTTPITFEKFDREDIEENYTVQDIPEYLSYLPSTTFYSESGNGIGYNYLSIRGFDQRRISISINGIPQNDPEDHNIYWHDFPDLLESTEMIQVQRGAGSGVVGYPAIGGSINIITSNFSDEPKFDISSSFGSYNTRKYSAAFSSGLIDNKYSIYAKVGQILSSGYRNLSWVDLKSYHLSAVRYDKNFTTQINIYGGPVSDGLVYNGLPKQVIKDKDLRRENYSYFDWDEGSNTFQPWSSKRRPEEIEEFSQPHFELLNEYNISKNVTLNSALFLVLGKGFFDFDGSWADTNYLRLTSANGFNSDGVSLSNILIRAQVENKQWGWIPRVNIEHAKGNLILGGELRVHRSVHWSNINFAAGLPTGVDRFFKYNYYEGSKDIINFYAHENYRVNEKLNLLAEVQAAYHNYGLGNEKFVGTKFNVDDLFINPRFGINYKFTPELNSYFSFARVTREPRLKNYYDAGESSGGAVPQFEKNADGSFDFDNPLVKPESMNSFELGTTYDDGELKLNANLFYMLFNDEIVKQGQVDRFGQPATGNADKTIHSGIELSGDISFLNYFQLAVNGSYSQNFISKGSQFIDYTDPVSNETIITAIDLKDNKISGFPELTFNAILNFRYSGITAKILTKYVGDFYSDNYDNQINRYLELYPDFIDYNDNKVEAYFVANLFASYEFQLDPVFKNVKIYGQVNNLFDKLYAAYAIGKEFFPAAERNFLAGIKVGI